MLAAAQPFEGDHLGGHQLGASVRVESMNIAYWQKRFDGARRVELSDEARNKLMQQVNLDGLDAQDMIGRVMSKAGMRVN